MLRLTDLNPRFYGHGGEGVTKDGQPMPRREGVLLAFDCPKCRVEGAKHGHCGCYLDPPMDGGTPIDQHNWKRTGDTFETMTLSPSILNRSCGAHFFIVEGRITADQEGRIAYMP